LIEYDFEPQTGDFKRSVIDGLSKPQKSLEPKFFYDFRGSELFEKIVEQPEYYVPDVEIEILKSSASEIGDLLPQDFLLIELGSGASEKIRSLLRSLSNLKTYCGIDISKEFLIESCKRLEEDFPKLDVIAICADYTNNFELPQDIQQKYKKRVGFFPGSTIGNLTVSARQKLFADLRKMLGDEGYFLCGFDLMKDKDVLESAYNDSSGVTAAFNKNLIARIQKELDAEIKPEDFSHQAHLNKELARIEMHLYAKRDLELKIGDSRFEIKKGESIHTESSHKFTKELIEKELSTAGFTVEKTWTDKKNYFEIALARAS
jgi:dimethylhistidine N-methyltransferase